MLLARAAAYAKHRDYYSTLFDKETMQPQIASPAFVRALEELVADDKRNSDDSLKATPVDGRQAIMARQCAMAITWPTAASVGVPPSGGANRLKAELQQGAPAIAFAELPGRLGRPGAQVRKLDESKRASKRARGDGAVPF